MVRSPEEETMTLTICHSCGLPQLYEALEGWKSICGLAYNANDIEGKNYFFSFLYLPLFLFYCSSFHDKIRADPAVAEGGNVL